MVLQRKTGEVIFYAQKAFLKTSHNLKLKIQNHFSHREEHKIKIALFQILHQN